MRRGIIAALFVAACAWALWAQMPMGGITFAGAGSPVITLIASTTGAGASTHSGPLTCPNATVYTVEIADGNGVSSFPVSDDNGNTWTSGAPQGFAQGGGASQQWYSYHKGAGALVTTAGNTTVVSGGNFPAWSFECWSNTKTGSGNDPIDVQNGSATPTSATSVPGSVTPSGNGALVITLGAGYTSTSNSISSGWTLLANQPLLGGVHFSQAMAYQIQTTAAAANPTWTFSALQAFVSSTNIVFKQGP